MRTSRILALCAVAGLTASCATPGIEGRAWTPQIDPTGVNQAKYEKDFAECKAFAEANPTADDKKAATKSAVRNGLLGAALIGVATVATGGIALLPMMAGSMATTGAVAAGTGALSGKAAADVKYQGIIANCLGGRGYRVLG